MAWLTGWESAKRIKIDAVAAKVPAAQSNFLLPLVLSAAAGAGARDVTDVFTVLGANKLKLAVTQSDGTTQLNVCVAYWDATAQKALLFVGLASLTASTSLYLYYDAGQADNATYVGVPGSTAADAAIPAKYLRVFHSTGEYPAELLADDFTGTSGPPNASKWAYVGNQAALNTNQWYADNYGSTTGKTYYSRSVQTFSSADTIDFSIDFAQGTYSAAANNMAALLQIHDGTNWGAYILLGQNASNVKRYAAGYPGMVPAAEVNSSVTSGKFRILVENGKPRVWYWNATNARWEWNGDENGLLLDWTVPSTYYIQFGNTSGAYQYSRLYCDNFRAAKCVRTAKGLWVPTVGTFAAGDVVSSPLGVGLNFNTSQRLRGGSASAGTAMNAGYTISGLVKPTDLTGDQRPYGVDFLAIVKSCQSTLGKPRYLHRKSNGTWTSHDVTATPPTGQWQTIGQTWTGTTTQTLPSYLAGADVTGGSTTSNWPPDTVDTGAASTKYFGIGECDFPGASQRFNGAVALAVFLNTVEGANWHFTFDAAANDQLLNLSAPGTSSGLTITISPAGAVSEGATWSPDGGVTNYVSGELAPLADGTYSVTYADTTSYKGPAGDQITVTGATGVNRTWTYNLCDVTITANPTAAATEGAAWSIDGGAVWRDFGTTATVWAGNYSVITTDTYTYLAPAPLPVTATAGGTVNGALDFTPRAYGQVIVDLAPAAAVQEMCKWRLWHATKGYVSGYCNSGAVVAVPEGHDYTVKYAGRPYRWTPPADDAITALAGVKRITSGAFALVEAGTVKTVATGVTAAMPWGYPTQAFSACNHYGQAVFFRKLDADATISYALSDDAYTFAATAALTGHGSINQAYDFSTVYARNVWGDYGWIWCNSSTNVNGGETAPQFNTDKTVIGEPYYTYNVAMSGARAPAAVLSYCIEQWNGMVSGYSYLSGPFRIWAATHYQGNKIATKLHESGGAPNADSCVCVAMTYNRNRAGAFDANPYNFNYLFWSYQNDKVASPSSSLRYHKQTAGYAIGTYQTPTWSAEATIAGVDIHNAMNFRAVGCLTDDKVGVVYRANATGQPLKLLVGNHTAGFTTILDVTNTAGASDIVPGDYGFTSVATGGDTVAGDLYVFYVVDNGDSTQSIRYRVYDFGTGTLSAERVLVDSATLKHNNITAPYYTFYRFAVAFHTSAHEIKAAVLHGRHAPAGYAIDGAWQNHLYFGQVRLLGCAVSTGDRGLAAGLGIGGRLIVNTYNISTRQWDYPEPFDAYPSRRFSDDHNYAIAAMGPDKRAWVLVGGREESAAVKTDLKLTRTAYPLDSPQFTDPATQMENFGSPAGVTSGRGYKMMHVVANNAHVSYLPINEAQNTAKFCVQEYTPGTGWRGERCLSKNYSYTYGDAYCGQQFTGGGSRQFVKEKAADPTFWVHGLDLRVDSYYGSNAFSPVAYVLKIVPQGGGHYKAYRMNGEQIWDSATDQPLDMFKPWLFDAVFVEIPFFQWYFNKTTGQDRTAIPNHVYKDYLTFTGSTVCAVGDTMYVKNHWYRCSAVAGSGTIRATVDDTIFSSTPVSRSTVVDNEVTWQECGWALTTANCIQSYSTNCDVHPDGTVLMECGGNGVGALTGWKQMVYKPATGKWEISTVPYDGSGSIFALDGTLFQIVGQSTSVWNTRASQDKGATWQPTKPWLNSGGAMLWGGYFQSRLSGNSVDYQFASMGQFWGEAYVGALAIGAAKEFPLQFPMQSYSQYFAQGSEV
ncbi:MAG: hypothetical protein AB1568_04795 [Thermodesulfobacteriota bacterium]